MVTKVHPHGEHVCICPSCGYKKTVGADERCNQQRCPECGDRMRAEDIGQFRSQEK